MLTDAFEKRQQRPTTGKGSVWEGAFLQEESEAECQGDKPPKQQADPQKEEHRPGERMWKSIEDSGNYAERRFAQDDIPDLYAQVGGKPSEA